MNDGEIDAFLRELAQLSARDLRTLLSLVFPLAGYEGDHTIMYSNQGGHALSLVYLATGRGRPKGLSIPCGVRRH
jgi:hypothetical protein